jgi:hypothetical protein
MLFEMSEKRIEDQKDAAVKAVAATAVATTAVQDTTKQIAEVIKRREAES